MARQDRRHGRRAAVEVARRSARDRALNPALDPARAEPELWHARDGTPLLLRPITAGDVALETAFLAGLSAETGYLRFLSLRRPQAEEIIRFTSIDRDREMAWVAVAAGPDPAFCGVARYARTTAADTEAEWAIVLADAWQSRGLGTRLMEKLIAGARADGVRTLSDIAFGSNIAMLALARKLGFTLSRDAHDATLTRMTLEL